jgi:perosamine synthetase
MKELAINGGTPIRETMINYGHQWIDETDVQAVDDVLRGDWLTTGPNVAAFEKAVCDYTGAKEAVVVNSGTAALHASTYAAEIHAGDEVIVTPLSFVASANCILYMGGKPVFADILPDTLNINPTEIEKKITPKTKAILVVDFAGLPCDHDKIYEIARKNNLMIIEDASHALGATYHGRKIGTLQELTTLSFHPVKHITTAEGGMILTDDSGLASKMRSFRTHGIDIDFHKRGESNLWLYDVMTLGYNYRLPDTGCALGISQLKKLDAWLSRRRVIAEKYSSAFSEIPQIMTPKSPEDSEHAWHLYIIRLNLEQLKVTRKEIFQALRAERIGVNVHYIPIPWLTLYQNLGYQKGNWPVTESIYERIISLPIFPAMQEKDIEDVIKAVQKVIRYFRK